MTDEPLKPCPFCGSTAISFAWHSSDKFMVCQTCRTCGPEAGYEETAAQDWNRRADDTLFGAIPQLLQGLLRVEEFEGKAHGIWDHVSSNLRFARLSDERRDALYGQTGEAVECHTESMQLIRKLYQVVQDAALARARRANGWISVEERLPEEGRTVLWLSKDHGYLPYERREIRNGELGYNDKDGAIVWHGPDGGFCYLLHRYSHWQESPPPPAAIAALPTSED